MTTQQPEVSLSARDREGTLLASSAYNGIDYVELVPTNSFALRVHFLNGVALQAQAASMTVTITGGDRIPTVDVAVSGWSTDPDGRPLLLLSVWNPGDPKQTEDPGDFSNYTLTIGNLSPLDPRFASTTFSFRALCPSDFDCAPTPPVCTPETVPLPPIDYTAKDFESFSRALADFSALRYPGWVERSEADFGMMFAEVLSAVGDELSYLQDRIAAEGTLGTATQRRSIVSLARLVDYEPTPALSATSNILCDVAAGTSSLPAGVRINALAADGTSIPFELGAGLADTSTFRVSAAWNFGALLPYWWDDGQRCLPRGSTEMWVQGHGLAFEIADPTTEQQGTALLLQTDLPGESLREIVHLTNAVEEVDHLFLDSHGNPTAVTHLWWGAAEALHYDHDLGNTFLGGNLIPATQGQRFADTFAIGQASSAQNTPRAIARWGPNSSAADPIWVFRWPLQNGPLAWLPNPAATPDTSAESAEGPLPELILTQVLPVEQTWSFVTSLLAAKEESLGFTIDPVAWRAVGFGPNGAPIAYDVDGDQGSTIRFGDGVFGLQPASGDVFQVSYRVGLGAAGNVPPDTIALVDPRWTGLVAAARNPFAASGGSDAETIPHVKQSAPQAFRAQQFRAVQPIDYEQAAESLPWVLQAGTSFRWTGSWLTVFTAADAVGGNAVSSEEEIDLINLLNRRRLAGYESYAPAPNYVSIDLVVTVCAGSEWLPADVERGVLARLGTSLATGNAQGFFFSDHFTFGTPLYRSRLEAAVQGVAGVTGVLSITYRLRGTSAAFVDLPPVVLVGSNEILRIENDPSFPERGTIRVIAEGGR